MNKAIIYISLSLFFVLSTLNTKAQVTIGSDKDPEEFSALEVISSTNGARTGIRMAQFDNSSKTTLETKIVASNDTKNKAKGLMIYNTDTKQLEYWNGTGWVAIPRGIAVPPLVGKNGISNVTSTSIGLGGTITSAKVDIDLKDKKLLIPSSTAGGHVKVEANSGTDATMLISPGKVGVGINTISDIKNSLHIESGTIGNAISIRENSTTPNELDVVYSEDNLGTAYLAPLLIYSNTIQTAIAAGTDIPVKGSIPVKLGSELVLTSGKWLILSVLNAYTVTTNTNGLGTWLYLYENNSGTITDISSYLGIHALRRTSNRPNNQYTTSPQVIMPLIVPDGNTKTIGIRSVTNFTAGTIKTLAGGYLIAVKLDDN